MTESTLDDRRARKATLIVAAVLAAVAAWNVYRGRPTLYWSFGSAAAVLAAIGVFSGAGSQRFAALWMRLGAMLGRVNSAILLGILYYGVMTPIGVISRLAGRDPLIRRAARRDSYWIPRERTRQTPERFERLF